MDEPISGNQMNDVVAGSEGTRSEGQYKETAERTDNRTLMGILSYLGPLVIISFIVSKEDSFVRFHIKQGLVLFSLWIIVWILGMYLIRIWALWQIVQLGIAILAIIGIAHVVKKEEKQLPLVGQFSRFFNI